MVNIFSNHKKKDTKKEGRKNLKLRQGDKNF